MTTHRTPAPAPQPHHRTVAVVGSGVAGLTAAYVLRQHSRVVLFEADSRLGGHADTHQVGDLAIDTGFIVHNEHTYPVLLRLFRELGIATQDSEMSMSVRDEATGLEYAGALGARGLFPTARRLADPAYLRMLTEVPFPEDLDRELLRSALNCYAAFARVAGDEWLVRGTIDREQAAALMELSLLSLVESVVPGMDAAGTVRAR